MLADDRCHYKNDIRHGVRRCNVVLIKDVCETVLLLEGFFQCNGGKLEEAEGFSLFTSFIVSLNRNRSVLACEFTELLCNHSLFVDQLYKNKSLALRTRDLFLFTNDHKTVNYYTTIHC